MKQNKKQKQALESAQYGLEISFKFLLSFGFILSLRFYFVHKHIEILPVLVSDGSSKSVSLF